ncbi:TPA: tRNA (N(6)-L-threonylcarbamoyladenosine(37)-C(2))-methylthiotransferase [Thermoplasmata archaeon]|nr:tRNA (N(6)-L-threonylcarbamoyladenosine(37)-C(2))-methylthiotransferase [Thermoplasmata archaeon]
MRAYVESYGCTLNQGEACEVEERLLSLGHHMVSDPAEADVAVLVACVVIEATERRMLKRLRELSSYGSKVVVTGCLAKAGTDEARRISPGAEYIAPGNLDAFEILLGRAAPAAEFEGATKETGVAIVPIATGCRGTCRYCITRLARGDLSSRAPESVIDRVAKASASGPVECRITAQDTAAYGADIGSDLVGLIAGICRLENDFRLRLGMMNPDSVMPILERLPELYADPRVFKFLHLPVQSASDRLLDEMGRRYTLAEFERVVSVFRAAYPESSLSTDMIVGYPGESDEDHGANLELIRRVRPDIVNVTRYSPRPGTEAFELGRGVVGWKAKDRSRALTEARFEVSLARNERLVGVERRALATERGKNDSTILRTDDYRQIVVRGALPLRRFYQVAVDGATPTYLLGSLPAGNR